MNADAEAVVLELLAERYPTRDALAAEIARLEGELSLPKATVFVLSDVHGEFEKLRHVINNGSGSLRPLVESTFAESSSPEELRELLTLIFYPSETLERMQARGAERLRLLESRLRQLLTLVRVLAQSRSVQRVRSVLPAEYRELLENLIFDSGSEHRRIYTDAVIASLGKDERASHLLRLVARVLRNLSVDEIVIAGDCYDRGPRGDLVVDYLSRQPNAHITWGNHDIAWMGAALGHASLIAHVLRISVRYGRLSQLEQGYGIPLLPLENLAEEVYAGDPAPAFASRGSGLRAPETLARMQKAAAVLQFKLEGQVIARHPEMAMESRRLLQHMDLHDGSVTIEGRRHPLKDAYFPTIDAADPYRLSEPESKCLERIRSSFLSSEPLWHHVRFMVDRGSMYLVRDQHVIFHGCVPVDDEGKPLSFEIDGKPRSGRALFETLEDVVARTAEHPSESDLDLFFYLWCGPRSPLFGKDKITTFERYLVEDPTTHTETKNPYFRLIHDAAFCRRVLTDFGVDAEQGMIVNGQVPVKVEHGESPLKDSGQAVTIDGAFSEAYGDHGYTLILDAHGTRLALHHHFESVAAAVEQGIDIIPEVSELRRFVPPKTVRDTEDGALLRARIQLLRRLFSVHPGSHVRP